MRHLMSPLDFSVEELEKLLNLADDIGKKYTYTFKFRGSHDESWRKGSWFFFR